jgi:hypothetical protein
MFTRHQPDDDEDSAGSVSRRLVRAKGQSDHASDPAPKDAVPKGEDG